MKALPIGKDDLKKIIEEDCYYVDKTKIIEEILENRSDVTLFPRPRRFGKSLAISTIDEFFNIEKKEENRDLFKGLYIEKSKYANEQGKYPVIKLNLKGIQARNWELMYESLRTRIARIFIQKSYILEKLNDEEKRLFQKFSREEATEGQYTQSIDILSEYLEKYYNRKVIILIDEYDVPIQNGYMNGFYDEIISFIKSLFNNSLKTNSSLKFAVMTGVLRVSKESIFSDLNNVKVYSVIDKKYDEYFGFTEKETKELLEYYGLELTEEVKNMYDGYIFGNTEIYNPWSIINYAEDKELTPYWINTSGDELLKDIFRKANGDTSELIEDLILGKSIECRYNEKVTFLDLSNLENEDTVSLAANFLLVSGYLTKKKGTDLNNMTRNIMLTIPNNEVRAVYKDVISNWMIKDARIISNELIKLRRAMENDDIKLIEKILNEALNHISFYDEKEDFYHGYVLGLFVEYLNGDYIVKSNREGGRGRFDVSIRARDNHVGIIVEFKVTKENEDIEEKAKEARNQIFDKEYYKELQLEGVENIHTFGIAFKEKSCKVV